MVVDFSATVGWWLESLKIRITFCSPGKVKKSYVSEEIAPGDGGRGWLDFIKSSEVVRVCPMLSQIYTFRWGLCSVLY